MSWLGRVAEEAAGGFMAKTIPILERQMQPLGATAESGVRSGISTVRRSSPCAGLLTLPARSAIGIQNAREARIAGEET
jgi:hypothetical protein